MSYWKATKAEVSEDGLSITISFKDQHSCSQMTVTEPAEEWKSLHVYRSAFNEPERRMMEATKRVVQYVQFSLESEFKKREQETK